jgi:hypothetical protein
VMDSGETGYFESEYYSHIAKRFISWIDPFENL